MPKWAERFPLEGALANEMGRSRLYETRFATHDLNKKHARGKHVHTCLCNSLALLEYCFDSAVSWLDICDIPTPRRRMLGDGGSGDDEPVRLHGTS